MYIPSYTYIYIYIWEFPKINLWNNLWNGHQFQRLFQRSRFCINFKGSFLLLISVIVKSAISWVHNVEIHIRLALRVGVSEWTSEGVVILSSPKYGFRPVITKSNAKVMDMIGYDRCVPSMRLHSECYAGKSFDLRDL